MTWLKLLLASLIVVFCVLLGYLAANKYRARKKFYAQMQLFNERYLTELNYARKPLPEFLAAYEYTGEFHKTVVAFAEDRAFKPLDFLSKDENGEVADYFSMLGKGDTHSQSGYFSAQKGELIAKKEETEREAKRRSELYWKLGLLGGLAFVILII